MFNCISTKVFDVRHTPANFRIEIIAYQPKWCWWVSSVCTIPEYEIWDHLISAASCRISASRTDELKNVSSQQFGMMFIDKNSRHFSLFIYVSLDIVSQLSLSFAPFSFGAYNLQCTACKLWLWQESGADPKQNIRISCAVTSESYHLNIWRSWKINKKTNDTNITNNSNNKNHYSS